MNVLIQLLPFLAVATAFTILDANSLNFGVGRASITCEEKNEVGLICSPDCKTILLCQKSGDKWTNETVQKCTWYDEYCNVDTGKCDSKPGRCKTASESYLSCTGPGIFPDPSDCQRYHACSKEGSSSTVIDCPQGTHYDVSSHTCVSGVNASTCLKPVSNCTKVGDSGPWPGSDNIYFICHSTGPKVYVCDPGYVYIHPSGCTKGTIPPAVTCGSTVGNIVDPESCTKYYYCGRDKVPVSKSCSTGYYFDKRTRSCQRGRCPY